MSFTTSASSLTVVVKILMVIQLGLSVAVFSAPLTWEREWSAMVVPITWSPVTAHRSRLTSQSKPFRWWNHKATSTHNKTAGTVTEAPHLSSTCRGFSCPDTNCGKNHIVEKHLEKNRHARNHQEPNRCGNDHHEKKQCGGKNQQNKSCGENQQQKRCGKNQQQKRCGKNQGKKHCGEKRNGQSCHDTTNCNRGQNNRQNNMKNGNKRRQLVVDNKVIVNVINDVRTPSPTSLLSDVKTSVAAVQTSTRPQTVVHSFSSFYSYWYLDIIMWLSILAIWVVVIFCIYNAYFISDRYQNIFN